MPYDIVVLSDTGCPEKYVALNVDAHYAIFNSANEDSICYVFQNYYEDAEVGIYNLKRMVEELISMNITSNDYKELVQQICELAIYAYKTGRSLHGIAD